MQPLLEVQDLHAAYRLGTGGDYPALAGVSFQVHAGETLGVLGESASGKSTLAAALLRLLPTNGIIQKGVVMFEGEDILQKQARELEKIRGGRIGLIFQEPSLALHPTIRIDQQIRDVITAHESPDRRGAQEKTLKLLTTLFPTEAKRIGNSYAHELSGGQRQRVLIAQAIACGPSLLIADEPTASLDPSTQLDILSLLQTLREQFKLAMILISHSPTILVALAHRVLVLYAGRVAEIGPTEELLARPRHPYTQALLSCLPPQLSESSPPRKSKLPMIAGDSPNLAQIARGCRFEPRCAKRMDVCVEREPGQVMLGENHGVSCFQYGG
jgi:oligopeptide/dipeptide ABC transporter ATP-binding protein